MTPDFNSRVRQLRMALNMTQAQLAKRSGIPQSTIAHIENGRNKSVTKLIELAQALETTPEYLMHGAGEKHLEILSLEEDSSDNIVFNRLNISAQMGGGHINDEHTQIVEQIKVTTAWARHHIGGDLAHIALITAEGDSMQGTIENGEIVFVNTAVTEYRSEGIYVIADEDGGLRIKRLYRHTNGDLSIISDNKAYSDELLSGEAQNQIRICGKVVAHSYIKKL